MNLPPQITPKVKNYLQMQNFFAWVGLMAPVAMAFFLMEFIWLPFSWKIIELMFYFLTPAFILLVWVTSSFKSEIESGKGIKLLDWTFKITLYSVLLFYLFTFVYSIVSDDHLGGFYFSFFMLYVVYFGMYLLSFFSLALAIKANSLLINSLRT